MGEALVGQGRIGPVSLAEAVLPAGSRSIRRLERIAGLIDGLGAGEAAAGSAACVQGPARVAHGDTLRQPSLRDLHGQRHRRQVHRRGTDVPRHDAHAHDLIARSSTLQ